MNGIAVRAAKSVTGWVKRTVSVFPRATTPDAVLLLPARTSSAPTMSRSWDAQGEDTSGASARLIARAKALARTGFPSLKRNPLRSVNVYVRRSRERFGNPVATSGTRRNASRSGLSGYVMRRAQVVSRSIHPGAVYSSAGSRESIPDPMARLIRKIPPLRASELPAPEPAPIPSAITPTAIPIIQRRICDPPGRQACLFFLPHRQSEVQWVRETSRACLECSLVRSSVAITAP